ncbi:MAG TPA: hypothetical protein PK733_10960 [Clostridiales bacterium]|nr:hypothetical protein [Clostridiales bacterium]
MNAVQLVLSVLIHPIDTFRIIKSRKLKINYLQLSSLLLFMVVVVRIIYIYMLHYPLSNLTIRDTNVLLEIIRMTVPIITWVVACYALTSIMDGETTFLETLISATLSMMPYIFFIIPFALLSKIMSGTDIGTFNLILKFIWIWVAMLIIIGVKELNDYSIIKTLNICVLNLITMILICAIIVLFLALASQLFTFINELFLEIRLIFN